MSLHFYSASFGKAKPNNCDTLALGDPKLHTPFPA